MIVLNGLGDEIHRFQGHASGGRLDEFVGAITLRNLRLAGAPSEFALNTPVSWRVLDSSSSPQISFHTVIGAFQLMREGKFGEAADELRRLGAKASSENYEETIGMWDALHTVRAVEHILSLRLDTLPVCGSLPYRSHRAICRIIDLLFESLHFAALYSRIVRLWIIVR